MEEYGRHERQLIHEYMGVNYSIVWDVVKNKIPKLELQISEVLSNEGSLN